MDAPTDPCFSRPRFSESASSSLLYCSGQDGGLAAESMTEVAEAQKPFKIEASFNKQDGGKVLVSGYERMGLVALGVVIVSVLAVAVVCNAPTISILILAGAALPLFWIVALELRHARRTTRGKHADSARD
jgi:hypothetical protein